jgi:hypothetical protein
MNILVSTVPRSGSTLLFNMCRLLFEKAYGKEKIYSNWYQFYKTNDEKEYNIKKIHDRTKKDVEWSNKIVTTVRDIRYIMASYYDFNKKFDINNKEKLKNACKGFIETMDSNIPISNYVFKYEDFFSDKAKVISELASALEIAKNKININFVIDEIEKIKTAKYLKLDKNLTQMHPNHISPKTSEDIKNRLTKEQLSFIEENCSCFLKKHNYKLTSSIKIL